MKYRFLLNVIALTITSTIFAASYPDIVEGSVKISQAANRLVTIEYKLKDAPGIVTVDICTNGVSIGESNFINVVGDVNKLVTKLDTPCKIEWQPCKSWPDQVITDSSLTAKITVWDPSSPPDYMAIDLVAANAVRYYVSSNAVPYGVLDDRYKKDILLMRRIHAAGVEWRMGSPAAPNGGESGREDHETPHLVSFTQDYYIGVYEVTYAQYLKFKTHNSSVTGSKLLTPWNGNYNGARGGNWPEDGHEKISETGFVYLMRKHSGVQLDFPTEAQWEYACRAGTSTPIAIGEATDENVNKIAVYLENSGNSPQPVGTKAPNAWGLYDMHGNRYEWCLDWYGDYANAGDIDPKGPSTGETRVLRGGHSTSKRLNVRSALRWYRAPSTDNGADGYRLYAPIPAEGSHKGDEQ